MKKVIALLVGIVMVQLLCPVFSDVVAADDEYQTTDAKYLMRPVSLQDAVDEIKAMIEQGKSRWDIAKRVTNIADGKIVNANPGTYEFHTWPSNWLWPLVDSADNQIFDQWRSQGGADKQYYDQANWVWDHKYGQCSENSSLVYYLLKRAGINDIRVFGRSDPDHAFVVWGMDEEADPNDASAWTDNVIVPDGWQGKVLRGAKAFQNRYCGNGGTGVADKTYLIDNTVPPRCGYRSDSSTKYPCCKKEPYAPCRGDSRLACVDGSCVSCGSINKPCCDNGRCDFANLECRGGKCVEKQATIVPSGNCQDLYNACCNAKLGSSLAQMPKITCGYIYSDYWCGLPGYSACAQAAFDQYLKCSEQNDIIQCDRELREAIDACRNAACKSSCSGGQAMSTCVCP
jgi:hypothetical protein